MIAEPLRQPSLVALCTQAVRGLSAVSRVARRLPATISYTAALAAVTAVAARLDPQDHARLMRLASTNLHNLRNGDVSTLVSSAFVVNGVPELAWWVALGGLMGLIELSWGSWHALGVFFGGHVGATLLVAGGLAVAVARGWLDPSVENALDVGISYGVMTLVGAAVALLPEPVRPVWVLTWAVSALGAAVKERDFTSAGHLSALVLGLAIGGVAMARQRQRAPR